MNEIIKTGGFLGVSSRLALGREEFIDWSYRRDPTHVVFYNVETVHWLAAKFAWKVLYLESPIWIFQVLSSGGRNLT